MSRAASRAAAVVLPLLARIWCGTAVLCAPAAAQNWTDLNPTNTPASLSGQWGLILGADSMATVPGGPVVLHGAYFQSIGMPSNQTFLFSGSNWSLAQATIAPEMVGRSFGSLAYNPINGRVMLYASSSYILPNSDTFEYDPTTNAWTLAEAGAAPGLTSPTAFSGHSVCSTPQGVLLFGGSITGAQMSNETWRWDGASWTQVATASAPPPRRRAFLAYDSARNVAVLFGGEEPGFLRLSDTWEFDGANWSQVMTDGAPSPRSSGSMVYDASRARCILRSGSLASGIADDTWEYDGSRWWQVQTASQPAQYDGRVLGYHEPTGRVIAAGASTFFGTDTTYRYGGTGATVAAFGTGCPGAGGTPELRLVGNSVPAVGATCTVEITKAISLYSWMLVGTEAAAPVPLGPLGMPTGCTGYLDNVHVTTNLIGNPASYSFAVPNNPGLQGVDLYLQGLVFDPFPATPLELIASNAARARIY